MVSFVRSIVVRPVHCFFLETPYPLPFLSFAYLAHWTDTTLAPLLTYTSLMPTSPPTLPPPPEKAWWRDDWSALRGPRGPSFWRNPQAREAFLAKEVRVDRGLEGALARGAEVLFSTDLPGVGGGSGGGGGGTGSGSGSSSGTSSTLASLQRIISKGRNPQRTSASTNRLLDAWLRGEVGVPQVSDGGSTSANTSRSTSSTSSRRGAISDSDTNPFLHNLYLAVPTNLEAKLLALLDIRPFSTSVKTTVNREGGLVGDDIRRRVDPLEAIPPRTVEVTPRRRTPIATAIDPLYQAPQFIKRASDPFVK